MAADESPPGWASSPAGRRGDMVRPGGSPGRTAADQPVAAAVQSNATERLLPAKVEPVACSRERLTVKR